MWFYWEFFLVSRAVADELLQRDEAEDHAVALPPRLRQPQLFMPRAFLGDMRDSDVWTRFRLTRGAILYLYGFLEDKLEPATSQSHAVPGMVKLLTTLYILGRGSFQTTSALLLGISQPTVSEVFMQVINAILELVP